MFYDCILMWQYDPGFVLRTVISYQETNEIQEKCYKIIYYHIRYRFINKNVYQGQILCSNILVRL